MGDGGGMHGEEEQQGARSAVAEDLDELQSWVDREIARAALRGAVGTGCAEGAALLEDGGAEGFGVGEKGRNGAIPLDAGSAAAIEAQCVETGGMSAGVGDGIDDGAGNLAGEEIEERGVEVGEGSGEGIIDFGRSEVGGAVVSVGGGEHEFLGQQALAAIDGSQHLGAQAGGDGEQFRGDESQTVTTAIVEVEGAGVEVGPVAAGDPSAGAVAAHGEAGRRSDFGFAGAGGEAVERGGRRVQGIGGDGDPVRGTAGE